MASALTSVSKHQWEACCLSAFPRDHPKPHRSPSEGAELLRPTQLCPPASRWGILMRLTVGSTETALPDVPCYHDHHQPRTRPVPSESLSAAPQPPSALWTGRKTPAEAGGWGAKCLVHRIAGCSAELLCSLIIFFSIFNQGTKRKGFGGIQAQQSLSQTQAEQRGGVFFLFLAFIKTHQFFLILNSVSWRQCPLSWISEVLWSPSLLSHFRHKRR